MNGYLNIKSNTAFQMFHCNRGLFQKLFDLLNLFLFQPETKLLENIVAIHLYKQYGEALFYYNKNVEVDFVVPDAGLAIQVSYSLRDEQTRNREVNALVSLSRFMNISTALIISKDQEETIEQDGISIKVIPVWKWLAD